MLSTKWGMQEVRPTYVRYASVYSTPHHAAARSPYSSGYPESREPRDKPKQMLLTTQRIFFPYHFKSRISSGDFFSRFTYSEKVCLFNATSFFREVSFTLAAVQFLLEVAPRELRPGTVHR